ncbi:MAG: hypothetical protein V1708_02630 [Candidatus Micrarchaeota archaeon]
MAREGEGQLRFSFDRQRPQNALRALEKEKLLHPRDKQLAGVVLSRLGETGADIEGIVRRIADGTLEADELSSEEPHERKEAIREDVAALVRLVKDGATHHYTQAHEKGELGGVALRLESAVHDAGAKAMLTQNAKTSAAILLLRLGITPLKAQTHTLTAMDIIARSSGPDSDRLTKALHLFARHDVENGRLYELLTRGLRKPGE